MGIYKRRQSNNFEAIGSYNGHHQSKEDQIIFSIPDEVNGQIINDFSFNLNTPTIIDNLGSDPLVEYNQIQSNENPIVVFDVTNNGLNGFIVENYTFVQNVEVNSFNIDHNDGDPPFQILSTIISANENFNDISTSDNDNIEATSQMLENASRDII